MRNVRLACPIFGDYIKKNWRLMLNVEDWRYQYINYKSRSTCMSSHYPVALSLAMDNCLNYRINYFIEKTYDKIFIHAIEWQNRSWMARPIYIRGYMSSAWDILCRLYLLWDASMQNTLMISQDWDRMVWPMRWRVNAHARFWMRSDTSSFIDFPAEFNISDTCVRGRL